MSLDVFDRRIALDDDGCKDMSESGLWLIGIGPGCLENMSTRALAAANSADYRFLEGYTSLLPPDSLEKLEGLVGNWNLRMRSSIENPDALLKLAKTSKVALLIVGDPLQATTHVDLQLRCEEVGVRCEVVHGISITTIVTGAVGLQSYRFGRQCTFAYPYGDYLPTSPLEIILSNRDRDLHTLALLDLDPTGSGEGDQLPMPPSVAIDVLRKMAARLNKDIEGWTVVLCSDMGTGGARIVSGTPKQIESVSDGRIHCLVLPASLHDVEATALERWSF